MQSEILIADEVAELLKVDRQRVYEMVRRNHLPYILLGQRQYRFSRQEIEKFLKNGGNRQQMEVQENA